MGRMRIRFLVKDAILSALAKLDNKLPIEYQYIKKISKGEHLVGESAYLHNFDRNMLYLCPKFENQ